jgi:hypothetical protein
MKVSETKWWEGYVLCVTIVIVFLILLGAGLSTKSMFSVFIPLIALGGGWWLKQFLDFRDEFSKKNAEFIRYSGEVDSRMERMASPGHSYAMASRGPFHSLDAELQSAEARWTHLSAAFPSLLSRPKHAQPILLVSTPYTKVSCVAKMQGVVSTLIKTRLSNQHQIVEPSLISELGINFDALRHPELAIANPVFYTFPFLLTWQRRHQWGVLPYATHARLGIIVRNTHPKIIELKKYESDYDKMLLEANNEKSPYWVSDPHYLRWLPMLLDAADVKSDPSFKETTNLEQPTVLSVGAYLHKELLPLACAVSMDPLVAASYTDKVRQIDQTLFDGLNLNANEAEITWNESSAIIVDLALLPSSLSSELTLLRLPHCVYVPVGIGFSVFAWPILNSDIKAKEWTYNLLRTAGDTLLTEKKELSGIGIEMDERFWAHPIK